MKVRHGDKEIELHPMLDVPKLAIAASLCVMAPGEAHTLTTVRGEQIALRFGDADLLLRQVLSAA